MKMTGRSMNESSRLVDEASILFESTLQRFAKSDIDLRSFETRAAKILSFLDESAPTGAFEELRVRTVHHFSCTGGTLLAKCIAAMPNVLVLNECDPHSNILDKNGKVRFTPTDVISLLKQGDPGVPDALVESLFLSDVKKIGDFLSREGRSLVLRDHTHSHFLTGAHLRKTVTLLEIVAGEFSTRSIVWVRNPVDSFASMKKMGWHKLFTPSDFNEYCKRYLSFLDRYGGVQIFKYEDFVSAPKPIMQEICEQLEIQYFDRFEDIFSIFHFSGDSGRGGLRIAEHPRREIDADFVAEVRASSDYATLVDRLNYEPL